MAEALELDPGEATTFSTSISLAQHSTRTHHPGEHLVHLVVNGVDHPVGAFTVVAG